MCGAPRGRLLNNDRIFRSKSSGKRRTLPQLPEQLRDVPGFSPVRIDDNERRGGGNNGRSRNNNKNNRVGFCVPGRTQLQGQIRIAVQKIRGLRVQTDAQHWVHVFRDPRSDAEVRPELRDVRLPAVLSTLGWALDDALPSPVVSSNVAPLRGSRLGRSFGGPLRRPLVLSFERSDRKLFGCTQYGSEFEYTFIFPDHITADLLPITFFIILSIGDAKHAPFGFSFNTTKHEASDK
mmetsp:Transcript_432/g.690  ORF Transcript_432/g.690 Transcript_432/m.690 type:complete len:236 (+) Transcript_432:178-885(+)